MRAVSLHQGELTVLDLPMPEPGRGQVLLRVLRCGICGSDLHAVTHADASADVSREVQYDRFMRTSDHVVLGHEFVGEVVAYGDKCRRRWTVGTPVVALPLLSGSDGVDLTGLTPHVTGGYAEYVVVQESVAFPVPEGADIDTVAMTEPLAVARHAVRRGSVSRGDVAVVIGCGPIGLAVILMLKEAGVETVVASDLSPARRGLAERCGADVVVDPREQSPWEAYDKPDGHLTSAPEYYGKALEAMRALRRVPGVPWRVALRAAEATHQTPKGPVVFECVGAPGLIEELITAAPIRSRVVVVGVCMEPDTFRPTMAITKEVDLIFAFCYDPVEFHDTLQLLASGAVDPSPLHTGTVGLDGVSDAFAQLKDPEAHAKILIDPHRSS